MTSTQPRPGGAGETTIYLPSLTTRSRSLPGLAHYQTRRPTQITPRSAAQLAINEIIQTEERVLSAPVAEQQTPKTPQQTTSDYNSNVTPADVHTTTCDSENWKQQLHWNLQLHQMQKCHLHEKISTHGALSPYRQALQASWHKHKVGDTIE